MTTQESSTSTSTAADNDKIIGTLRKDLSIALVNAKESKAEASRYYNELMDMRRRDKQEQRTYLMFAAGVLAVILVFSALIYGNIDRRADAEQAARSWAIGSIGYSRHSTTAACRTGVMQQGTLCVVRNGIDGRTAFVRCDGSRWNNDGCYPVRAQVYYSLGSVDALDGPAAAANPR